MKVVMIHLINACKVATMACIAGFAYTFGFQTMRAWTYVALHGTYLVWWFLHQRLSPTWGRTVFGPAETPVLAALVIFLAVGPGYALPGYYAFKSAVEPQPWVLMASTMMFAWGSLINCAADFYKDGFKAAKPGAVVTSGPYQLARHINWFGDWLRYGSFAVVGGCAPLAFFPLAWTAFVNLASLKQRDEGQAKRNGAEGPKYLANTPAVIPWRLLI